MGDNMKKGVITKGIGGFYYIDTETGVYECRARGIFRKEGIRPTVGDLVEISILDEMAKKGSLDVILPRRNELIRPKVANVDQAMIVFAAKEPDPNPDLLDRFLLLVEEQKLDVVIVLNKIDRDEQKDYLALREIYQQAGYTVVSTCTYTGEGIDALREHMIGKISVFAGPSGVGKSSLINAAFPGFSLNTGEISQKIQRGKHTTRHAELIRVAEDTYLVDSPGFMSLSLEHIPSEQLQYYFREFTPFIGKCRYSGCHHINEPECAVKNAVGTEIPMVRYERYRTLFQQAEETERRR